MVDVLDIILAKAGVVRKKVVDEQLNFACNAAKRLDEHRELVESIQNRTGLFEQYDWHIGHMATQDDYLMRIYHMVNEKWPTRESMEYGYVRARPEILGACQLPEYLASDEVKQRPAPAAKTRHLDDEGKFEFDKAKTAQFYLYYIDDESGFAVGKRDWAPISVVIGMALNKTWLMQKLASATWVASSGEMWGDWISANQKVLSQLNNACNQAPGYEGMPEELAKQADDYFSKVSDAEIEHKVMAHVRYQEMAYEYMRVMSRVCPVDPTPEIFRLVTPPCTLRYHKTDVTKNLMDASSKALASVNAIALAWFETNGFDVDAEKLLVKVDGYQPLFFVGTLDF